MTDVIAKVLNCEDQIILPIKSKIKNKTIYYDVTYDKKRNILLINNDIENIINNIPRKSLDLIVSSPPYNLGKPYEKRVKFDDYLDWNGRIIKKLIDCLSDKGSICWEIGNFVSAGEVFPLDLYYYQIFKKYNLKLRNRIIWYYRHGVHASRKFSGRYETLLWFTKTDNYTFNLDPVRERQLYPGKTSYKEGKKGVLTGNPNGKNPSDVWSIIQNDWDRELWSIPNVKANHVEKTIHTCQFPIALVERLVLALSNENEVVFDPFVGVGSTMIAAIKNKRRTVGVDKDKLYTDIAFKRICAYYNGTLKMRPLEKPIWIPNGNEKVSKVPDNWKNLPLWKK